MLLLVFRACVLLVLVLVLILVLVLMLILVLMLMMMPILILIFVLHHAFVPLIPIKVKMMNNPLAKCNTQSHQGRNFVAHSHAHAHAHAHDHSPILTFPSFHYIL